MKPTRIALIAIGTAIVAYGGFRIFNSQPAAKIVINSDGTGMAYLGNKSASFTKGQGVVIGSYNGFQLSAGSDKYSLSRFGKTLQSGETTPFTKGSGYIEIIRNT